VSTKRRRRRLKQRFRLAMDTGIPPVWFRLSAAAAHSPFGAHNGYTVEMNSDAIERLETKIAFMESANVELSDVVYKQAREIQSLRARIDALAQRLEAAQTTDPVRTPEEERPPHY